MRQSDLVGTKLGQASMPEIDILSTALAKNGIQVCYVLAEGVVALNRAESRVGSFRVCLRKRRARA
ncbi:MAG: hypothetical protein CVT82_15070 [Alphaproteobacteria bacterium HGW-Alphaproteobacteria-4]|jgi:hypothetical protein|nr:MAG: hypothetical protein CVT82_15070 [Alphaproteobacteria bacterium HGW-Alphaproteobacteria-4]